MKKILFCASALLFLVFMTSALMGEEQSAGSSYTSSQQCQKCHEREYLSWSGSMHARSVSTKNILFTRMYELAVEETKGQIRQKCLSCHAPIAVALDDLGLKKSISKEGVSCDYCHTLKAVKGESGMTTILSSPGETKYGSYTDSVTEAHKVEFSELHTKSDFCLKCHGNVINPAGIEICATESEYRGSIYEKRNIQCQLCHMPPISGKAANNGPEREKIYIHNFAGGYSSEFLGQAANIQLKTEETEAGKQLTVTVLNLNGGHYIPTSSGLRMMFLKIFAYDNDGKELWTNWKEDPYKEDSQSFFAKILTDDEGNPALPWKATKIAFDNRLKVRESRKLTYALPQDLNIAKVTANLQYKLAPDALLDKLKIDEPTLRNTYTISRAELSLQQAEGGTEAPAIQKTTQRSLIRTINVYTESWKFTPNEIRIKQGERVKLIISTLDDTHGFRVKELGISVKVFRNKPAEVEIEGKEKGEYKFDCPVPCGDRCPKMKGVIIVE